MSEYKKTTVVFPLKDERILLGMKKRGFGAGWWNGFGGKLEPGETYSASAVRETYEEAGLVIDEASLTHVADIVFRFDGSVDVVTRAYTVDTFENDAVETEEMRPEWFPLERIPYETMWPGDNQWIPKALGVTALRPQGFIIDFTGNNELLAIEPVNTSLIGKYF